MSKLQERKWIRKIKLFGSSKDADSLVRFYYDEIYIFVARQTNDKETAGDLTQDIFVSMLHSISSYQENLSSFRTWLYRIATNKIIDYRRKSMPDMVSLDNTDEILLTNHLIDSDFEKKLAQSELLGKIEVYISSFQTDIQQIFRLHIFGEQTFREIADLIQIPEETVKTKYYRLIKQIRREFYEEYRETIDN